MIYLANPDKTGRRSLFAASLLLVLSAFLLIVSPAEAQLVRGQLTAAYLFRLAENVQWPNSASISHYKIHLIDANSEAAKALQEIARNKTLHGKPFEVSRSSKIERHESAHLIYLAKEKAADYPELFRQVEGRSVLLVSDSVANKRIIMINLFETAEHQIRFELNRANILNQNLGVNPDIVLLGGTEIDVAKLYREGLISLRQLEKRAAQLESKRQELEANIAGYQRETDRLANTLAEKQQLISEQQKAVAREQQRLKAAEEKTRQQQQIIAEQKALVEREHANYEKLARQNREQEAIIADQQKKFAEERERYQLQVAQTVKLQAYIDQQQAQVEEERKRYEQLSKEVHQREVALAEQAKQIEARSTILADQDQKIRQQEQTLAQQNTTISTQQRFLFALSAAVALAVLLVIAVLRGYRGKKLAHARLLEQNLLLEKNTKELEVAKDVAETATRFKSEFLANMSHEIRTPMNAVLGFTEILAEIEYDQKKIRYISNIHTAADALLNLINDILDLSKIEAGKLELQYAAVSIERLFGELQSVFERKVADRGLELHTSVAEGLPAAVVLDETRLRQILINLLGNAIKFTDQGSIRLTADFAFSSSTARSQIDLTLTVADTGVGIAAEQQQRIFEAFAQTVGQKTVHYGGTGLGLTITRRLVEAMGGSIDVESEPGLGSTFTVVFSGIEIAAGLGMCPEQETKLAPTNLAFEPATLLIADDIDFNREVIASFLADWPFRLLFAANGKEFLKLVRQHHPDLALLDMRMPVLDGYEASRLMKEDPVLREIPIVAVTASGLKHDEEIIRTTCDGYVRKPISKQSLLKELMKFLPCQLLEVQQSAPDDELPEMIYPPPEVLEQFFQSAILGDQGQIQAQAEALAGKKYRHFADMVQRLATSFHFDALIEFIDAALKQEGNDADE